MQFALFPPMSSRGFRGAAVAVTGGKLFFRSVTLSAARDRESWSGSFPSVPGGNVRRLTLCELVRAPLCISVIAVFVAILPVYLSRSFIRIISMPSSRGGVRAPFFTFSAGNITAKCPLPPLLPLIPCSFVRVLETTVIIIVDPPSSSHRYRRDNQPSF